MIGLIFFICVGLLLFVFLLILARRGRAEGGARVLVEAHQALSVLQGELLPQRFVSRLFARDDLDFVRSEGEPHVEQLFRSERKRVAVLWIRRMRQQIELLRRLHLGAARFYARLDFRSELTLAWNFALLLVSCRVLEAVFALGGAYAVPKVADTVAGAATRVCQISGQSLAFLSKGGLGNAGDRPFGA